VKELLSHVNTDNEDISRSESKGNQLGGRSPVLGPLSLLAVLTRGLQKTAAIQCGRCLVKKEEEEETHLEFLCGNGAPGETGDSLGQVVWDGIVQLE